MHGGGGSSGPVKKARIEIIPLIDVIMFLLATFVLFTLSMNKNKGASVNLPIAETGKPDPRDNTVTISINVDGELFIEKDKSTWDGFVSFIASYPKDGRVLINFDKEAKFGQAMSVLNEIRKAQIEKVAIETKVKRPGAS